MTASDAPLDSLVFTAGLIDDRDHADQHGQALLDVLRERAAQLDAVRAYTRELEQPGPDVPRAEVVARLRDLVDGPPPQER
jgi:hypothetical protein